MDGAWKAWSLEEAEWGKSGEGWALSGTWGPAADG